MQVYLRCFFSEAFDYGALTRFVQIYFLMRSIPSQRNRPSAL